jgi:hypothetical protein
LHSEISLGITVIEGRSPDMTAIEERIPDMTVIGERNLSLVAAEEIRDPAC